MKNQLWLRTWALLIIVQKNRQFIIIIIIIVARTVNLFDKIG